MAIKWLLRQQMSTTLRRITSHARRTQPLASDCEDQAGSPSSGGRECPITPTTIGAKLSKPGSRRHKQSTPTLSGHLKTSRGVGRCLQSTRNGSSISLLARLHVASHIPCNSKQQVQPKDGRKNNS